MQWRDTRCAIGRIGRQAKWKCPTEQRTWTTGTSIQASKALKHEAITFKRALMGSTYETVQCMITASPCSSARSWNWSSNAHDNNVHTPSLVSAAHNTAGEPQQHTTYPQTHKHKHARTHIKVCTTSQRGLVSSHENHTEYREKV